MNFFKILEEPFKLKAEIDFCENSTDGFEIYIYGQVGEEKLILMISMMLFKTAKNIAE